MKLASIFHPSITPRLSSSYRARPPDGLAWGLTVRRGDPDFVFGTLRHFLQIGDRRTI